MESVGQADTRFFWRLPKGFSPEKSWGIPSPRYAGTCYSWTQRTEYTFARLLKFMVTLLPPKPRLLAVLL
jgi:hypothetical protein